MKIKTGLGFDVHRLRDGLDLWLGGVKIPHTKGCVAHSDGDVLLHALCDALFGAAGLRDIGNYFPDNSDEFKGIDSKLLLERTWKIISEKGYIVGNIDSVLILEAPKIMRYIPDMKNIIAEILEMEPDDVSIKATTNEKLGPVGREEGVEAMVSVLIYKL